MFEQLGMSGISDEDIEMVPMLSLDEDEDAQKSDFKSPMPLLPLRNNVLFPGVVIPISVGRDKSIKAVKKAYKSDKFIGVLAQKDTQTEEPSSEDLNKIGTIARIIKMLKMRDGGTTLIIQGVRRFELIEVVTSEPFFEEEIAELKSNIDQGRQQDEIEDEFGDVIFSLINYGRFLKIDPEAALEKVNRKFISRFEYIESKASKPLNDMSLEEMDALWNEAKRVKKEENL